MTGIHLPRNTDLPNLDAGSLSSLKGSQQPVLVVGMHNSGTSILTEILHKNGIFFGANMHHHESYFFSNFINDRMILGGGGNWAKLPLMSEEEVLSYTDTVGPFIQKHWVADYLQWGYDGKSQWGIKDPRLCILLPMYLEIFPKAKVIHIRRNINDIAASLTMKYKEGVGVLDDFEQWKELAEAYTQRVLDYSGICFSYYEINYEELCIEPETQIKALLNHLELPFTNKLYPILSKVTTSRIGSYQRFLDAKKHPWRSNIKAFIKKVLKIGR
jgi:hypothetical protein